MPPAPEEPAPCGFRHVSEEIVHRGPVVTLSRVKVESPSGEILDREIIHHPGAVAVVAVLEGPMGPEAVMVRQYRAPLDQVILEIPAGKRDVTGEDPAVTAARELREEVGLASGELHHLVGFHNSPGFCDEFLEVYLSVGPTPVADERQGEEELAMTIERVPLSEVPAMIADGRITDAKSIIGLLLAITHLEG